MSCFLLNICGRFRGFVRLPDARLYEPGLTALWIGVSTYAGWFASGQRHSLK